MNRLVFGDRKIFLNDLKAKTGADMVICLCKRAIIKSKLSFPTFLYLACWAVISHIHKNLHLTQLAESCRIKIALSNSFLPGHYPARLNTDHLSPNLSDLEAFLIETDPDQGPQESNEISGQWILIRSWYRSEGKHRAKLGGPQTIRISNLVYRN